MNKGTKKHYHGIEKIHAKFLVYFGYFLIIFFGIIFLVSLASILYDYGLGGLSSGFLTFLLATLVMMFIGGLIIWYNKRWGKFLRDEKRYYGILDRLFSPNSKIKILGYVVIAMLILFGGIYFYFEDYINALLLTIFLIVGTIIWIIVIKRAFGKY